MIRKVGKKFIQTTCPADVAIQDSPSATGLIRVLRDRILMNTNQRLQVDASASSDTQAGEASLSAASDLDSRPGLRNNRNGQKGGNEKDVDSYKHDRNIMTGKGARFKSREYAPVDATQQKAGNSRKRHKRCQQASGMIAYHESPASTQLQAPKICVLHQDKL